jgi:5-methylcytosine-specific restriction protein B
MSGSPPLGRFALPARLDGVPDWASHRLHRPVTPFHSTIMSEAKESRLTKYLPLLLDALRSTDPKPMKPAEAAAWIQANSTVPDDELERKTDNGRESIFQFNVRCARNFLCKGGFIDDAKRGFWSLTESGRHTKMNPQEAAAFDAKIRAETKATQVEDLEFEEQEEFEDEISYWLVGAFTGGQDQTDRFLVQGIWENNFKDDRIADDVRSMEPGDRIIIKASYTRKHDLPFDVNGKSVSVMAIMATGTILENPGNGRSVRVAWDKKSDPREWYFFTYRKTLSRVQTGSEEAQQLLNFAIKDAPQDYGWWLSRPYWAKKYGLTSKDDVKLFPDKGRPIAKELKDEGTDYSLADIIDEGCFLPKAKLEEIADALEKKKNVILQGPPGTGKTWLAKRLGYARLGSNSRETESSRIRVVQFHAALCYEDFVRGWRPSGVNGKASLQLMDGIMMQAITAAKSDPNPFVLVIEEINRGNPAQIFGEMLTLLEDTKRNEKDAMELTYRRDQSEVVFIPDNLFVIGTMNIADRSLAIVDFALRRRFAFFNLEPVLGKAWRKWCVEKGIADGFCDKIEARFNELNQQISSAVGLGPQFCIGHSFVTPGKPISDAPSWFRAKVLTEIGPQLEEYWPDSPATAKEATDKLLSGI